MKINNRGFTLIELLVVIAIIGILSAVVFASLNTARQKGQIAAAKTAFDAIRSQAELDYDSAALNNNYNATSPYTPITDDHCEAATAANTILQDSVIQNALKSIQNNSGGHSVECGVYPTEYSVAVQLADGKFWCIDSTGVSRGTLADGTTPYDSLNGSTNSAHASMGSGSCK